MFKRRYFGLANVDAHRNGRPSSTGAQFAQALCDRVRPVVIKTEAIDQRLLLRQSKDARLGISRLRFCGNRSDLDKAEPERCPCGNRNAAFIQSGGKSNRIWKGKAEKRFGF